MGEWVSIAKVELLEEIQKGETELSTDLMSFWNMIKINPEKCSEPEFGNEGNGFWVVAIFKDKVVWYNDIEDGFNISNFETYGQIKGYYCNQDTLPWAMVRLYEFVKYGLTINGQVGPPEKLE